MRQPELVFAAAAFVVLAILLGFRLLVAQESYSSNAKLRNPATTKTTAATPPLASYSSSTDSVFYNDGFYFKQAVVVGADPETFSSSQIPGSNVPSGYAKDRTYQHSQAQSFKEFGFATDTEHVYAYGRTISRADPMSFVMLNSSYEKDAHYVYYGRQDVAPILQADTQSFAVLDEGFRTLFANDVDAALYAWRQDYAMDKNNVYHSGVAIAGADPNTFRLLSQYYAKDSKNIYFISAPVPLADAESFNVVLNSETYDSRDKNHKYKTGKIVE